MSTTFGIRTDSGTIEEIAFRGNGTGIFFTNPIAPMLANFNKVIALDNSPQGIKTIGDIKKAILDNNK